MDRELGFLQRFATEVVGLFVESAPYLLVGFLLAGLLKVFLPKRFVEKKLGGNDLRSILRAAIYGLPLPLCSCSVLPTAASLRKAGASRAATTSFLISTPETGVDSISVTYALLDPVMTVVRPLAAFVTAIVTGLLVAVGVREDDAPGKLGDVTHDADCEALDHSQHAHAHAHAHVTGDEDAIDWEAESFADKTIGQRIRLAFRYAFGPLLDDLTPWFLIGFALSGLVAALVPESLFTETVPSGWASMGLMILIGTPIYICATASTPIAAALVAKGLDPGAALVFLLVGPATNVTTLLVVSKLLGRRTVGFYLAGIVGFALIAGLLTNALYVGLAIDLRAVVAENLGSPSSSFAQIAALVFVVLLIKSAMRIRVWRWAGDGLAKMGAPFGVDPRTGGWRVLGGLALLGLLGASCTTWVGFGESGWLTRFGKIVAPLDEPGLHVHLPWPITRSTLMQPDAVRHYEFGFRSITTLPAKASFREQGVYDDRLEAEGQMLTGDDPPAILQLAYSTELRISDLQRARYGVRDLDELARAIVEESMRRTISQMTAVDVLYQGQGEIAPQFAKHLESGLTRANLGLELVSASLRDVHAPSDAHAAYRRVASAEEEAQTRIHASNKKVAERTSAATRGAETWVTQAKIDAYATRVRAHAQSDALTAQLKADQLAPALTRRALEIELAGELLRDLQLVLVTIPGLEVHALEVDAQGNSTASFFSNLTGGAPITDPLRSLAPSNEH